MTIGLLNDWKVTDRVYTWRFVRWTEDFDGEGFAWWCRALPFVVLVMLVAVRFLFGLQLQIVTSLDGDWSKAEFGFNDVNRRLWIASSDAGLHSVATALYVLVPVTLFWSWLMLRWFLEKSRIHKKISKPDIYTLEVQPLGQSGSMQVNFGTLTAPRLARRLLVCFDDAGHVGLLPGPDYQTFAFVNGDAAFKTQALKAVREHPLSPYQAVLQKQREEAAAKERERKARETAVAKERRDREEAEARRRSELARKEEERKRKYDVLEDW